MARIPINMPKMSMTMETGTLVEWSVAVGDEVRDGDVICVVTTDKVDMDVEAVANGTVAELVAQPGDVLPVGQPMAYLDSESEDLLGDLFGGSGDSTGAAQDKAADTEAVASGDFEADSADEPSLGGSPVTPGEDAGEPAQTGQAPAGEQSDAGDGERIRAVPLARTLAKELGVDLRQVAATGPGHVVRARDVREAAEAKASQPQQAQPKPQPVAQPTEQQAPKQASPKRAQGGGTDRRSRIRQATAKVMNVSAGIPQFTAYRTLDLTQTARARKAGLKGVSWTTIMVRAYAMVLEQYPNLNASWGEGGVQTNDDIIVSLAVDTPDGLLAPAVRNPQRTSMKALDAEIRDIASRLKDGDQDPELFVQGTGTVSNLGGMGVDQFNALITPPQATALSLGSVNHKVGVDDEGEPKVFMGCTVGLTIDHRVADGADAARALAALQEFLADPISLLA